MYNKLENYPWLETEKYLELLRADSRYTEISLGEFEDQIYYKIMVLDNLKYYKESNNLEFGDKLYCFKLNSTKETEKYYKKLMNVTDEVYLFFEENSRYTHSNSPVLFVEERLRQGIKKIDVEEQNERYREFMVLLDESLQNPPKSIIRSF